MVIKGAGKPWFNGQFVGRGLSLPIAWQGWAVLGVFAAASIACLFLLRGELRALAQAVIFVFTMGLIHAKRA